MIDILIAIVILAIIGGIVWYLIRAKKRGDKCIGCPYGKQCCNKSNCDCKNKENKINNDN